MFGENLVESPKRCKTDDETNDECKNLPVQRYRWYKAGGEIKNGAEKRTEGGEGWVEFGGDEEFGDPCEGPVVPVKACEGQE